MNYLPKSNGKDNCLKSCLCHSCKNDEMSLRPFWHNTVDIGHVTKTAIFTNSRWRTSAILKIALSPYLSRELSSFDQIW